MIDFVRNRTLAEALGDNDSSLYRYLRKIASRALPPKFCGQKDDFIHDFLVDLLEREDDPYVLNADMSNGNINENLHFRNFLGKRLRWYISPWVKKQVRRIKKPKKRSRPVEKVLFPHPIEAEEEGKPRNSRLEYASFQLYQRNADEQFPGQELVREERIRCLQQALETLKPIYKEVVTLFYYKGLSTSEISQRLDVSKTTVTSRLYWARTYLRRDLYKSEYGESLKEVA